MKSFDAAKLNTVEMKEKELELREGRKAG